MIDARGHEEAALLHEQAERIADTERVLAEVLGQVPTVPLRPPGPGRRRRWPLVAAAAALVAAVVAGVAIGARDHGGEPGDGPSSTTQQPSTAVTPPAVVIPSTVASPSTTSTSSSGAPDSPGFGVVDPDDDWTAAAERDGIAWESTGIEYRCADVWWDQQQMSQRRCTQLSVDPSGVLVTFDPATRTVTRHTRAGGPVSFVLPEEYVDPSLVAAGPDDVAYFALDNPWPQSADVLAVSVAAHDAGAVLRRLSQAMGFGDADLFVTSEGPVLTDWYAQGFRPPLDAQPFVEWVRRDTGEGTSNFTTAALDDEAGIVQVGDRQWSLGDRLVPYAGPGSQEVLATFDGGFIAWYRAYQNMGHDTEIMRGYPDGTVEHWVLPWATPMLEPTGTLLLVTADHIARLAPFPPAADG